MNSNLYLRPGRSTIEHPGRIKEKALENNIKQSPFRTLNHRSSARAKQKKAKRVGGVIGLTESLDMLDHGWLRNSPGCYRV